MNMFTCCFRPLIRSALHKSNIPVIHNKNLITAKYISTSSNNIRYAQATPSSHPHLLKNGEVTPGLTAEIYKTRRQNMMEKISNISSDSESNAAHLIVIPSASLLYMSESIPYPFRQNTDFLYLCGFKEPNSVLLLTSIPNKSLAQYESTLFITKPTPHSEKWEGAKMNLNTVTTFLGIDRAHYLDDFEKFLQSFTKSNKKFTLWYDCMRAPFPKIHAKMQDFMQSVSGRFKVQSSREILHKLRVIKCDSEAQLMRDTCKIGAESMKEVIKFSHGMVPEAHLLAKMDYECRMRGANHLAFPPVVAGGDRANTIHYIDSNNIVKDGDMVLMDSGCEFHGYSSDISRTWPVNGKFTDPQRELYQVVLKVQEDLIRMCQTKVPLDELFEIMCQNLGKEFQSLGIIPKSATEHQLKEAAYELCPHHVGHYLGMDVHDTDKISRGIKLQTGMVITIEPGVYISRNNTKYPEKYRGICIRIEDDVLITEDGYEVLTTDCPKCIDKIEDLCKKY